MQVYKCSRRSGVTYHHVCQRPYISLKWIWWANLALTLSLMTCRYDIDMTKWVLRLLLHIYFVASENVYEIVTDNSQCVLLPISELSHSQAISMQVHLLWVLPGKSYSISICNMTMLAKLSAHCRCSNRQVTWYSTSNAGSLPCRCNCGRPKLWVLHRDSWGASVWQAKGTLLALRICVAYMQLHLFSPMHA